MGPRLNRTDRLYALVEELRSRAPRPVTAGELATRFEVSIRTIERDLLALLQAGVPIWAERGRRGGYTLDPGVTLPPLNFTPREAAAIAIALAAVGPHPFSEAGRTARRKLVAAMGAAGATAAVELTQRILVAEPTPLPAAPEVVRLVGDAVVEGLVLEIEYTDRGGNTTTRTVEAHGMYGSAGTWALVAWCRLRDAGRVFRLDRIGSARATGERNPERDTAAVLGWMPPQFRRPELA